VARILAVEPDPSQAVVLSRVIERAGAEPLMADSKEAAILALDRTTPDLILVSALLSPRDESELADHLRVREGVDHVQILTIPLLAVGDRPEPIRPAGGFLSAFKRKRPKTAPAGCDPDRYGDELKGYLKLALEARAEREAQRLRDERARQRLSRASGASEVDAVARPDEADGASEANTKATAAWDDDEKAPPTAPVPVAASKQDAESIWQPIEEEPAGLYGDTPDPVADSMPAAELAMAEEPEPQPSGASVGPPDSEQAQAAGEPIAPIATDVQPDAPVPAEPGTFTTTPESQAGGSAPEPVTALEAGAGLVAPDDDEDHSRMEPEAEFRLTPPPDTAEPDAADPAWALVADTAVHSPEDAPALDFESPGGEEPVPAIEPAIDPPAPALAGSSPDLEQEAAAEPPAGAPFERASMPSLEFALGPGVLDTVHGPASGAQVDEDRFSLSISSFEVDRRESDDYLLAAASETFKPATPAPPPARSSPESRAWHPATPRPSPDLEPGTGEPEAASAVEIWQALPEWVETCPPLEAYMDPAPARPMTSRPPERDADRVGAKREAPDHAPEPPPATPPVDARWIATALDALRSDIQQLRAQSPETRASDSVAAQAPAPPQARPVSPPSASAGEPTTARPPALPAPPPAGASPGAHSSSGVAKEPPVRKKKARKPKPVEDEWGMFDPSQAGVEALVALLEAKAEQEDAEEEDEEERDAPTDPPPVTPDSRPRLAPLSMWAHVDTAQQDAKAPARREPNDLRALIDGLAVPAQVASVCYPTGCRIRRVRMARDPGGRKTKGESDEPVIILSRRALGRGAAGKDDPGTPTPC
jgi:CheY-like chemotaxis protein